MAKPMMGWLFTFFLAAIAWSGTAAAQSADLRGSWQGKVAQNAGSSGYTVILTITRDGAISVYPELNCKGKMTRVATSGGYIFYTEAIIRDGKNKGGSCIDGTVTIAPAGKRLAWGWVGSFDGRVYVAWANLTRK